MRYYGDLTQCACTVHQALSPPLAKGLGTRLCPCVTVCVSTFLSVCRQKTPIDSEQEPSDDNEDEWTYPERKRETKVITYIIGVK